MANQAKRRVKNPETFRERALKTGAGEDGSRLKNAGVKVGSPLSKAGRQLGKSKLFRLLGKILFPSYFRDSWRELKLVQWPSWSESRRLTLAVIIFAVVFGVSIAGVDWVLDKAFRHILLK